MMLRAKTTSGRVAHLRAELNKAKLDLRDDAIEINRIRDERLIELRAEGMTWTEVSRSLSTCDSWTRDRARKLACEGRFPLLLASSSDDATRLRNHIILAWRRPRVRTEVDLALELGLDVASVAPHVEWLIEQGHIRPKEPADEEDRGGAAPASPVAAPRAAARPATLEELRAEVARRVSEECSVVTLRTSYVNGHRHQAELDSGGCGHTTPDESGHSHRVTEYLLRSREKHVHDLVIP